MSKSALELIPSELQAVAMSDANLTRAIALAKPANLKVREAADARMRFEDEPSTYTGFLHAQP